MLDKGKFALLLQELKTMVESSDSEASNKLVQLLTLPGVSAYKEQLTLASKMIGDYEFDEALEILNKIQD